MKSEATGFWTVWGSDYCWEKEDPRLNFPHTYRLYITQASLNLCALPKQITHGLHAWRHTSLSLVSKNSKGEINSACIREWMSYFQSLLTSCLLFQPWEAHSLLIEKAFLPSHLHSLSKLSTEACKHKAQPQQWAWETALFLARKTLKTTIFLRRTNSRTITSKSCLEVKPFLTSAFSSSFKSPVLLQFYQRRGMLFEEGTQGQ